VQEQKKQEWTIMLNVFFIAGSDLLLINWVWFAGEVKAERTNMLSYLCFGVPG
jgi:hypothetical protein